MTTSTLTPDTQNVPDTDAGANENITTQLPITPQPNQVPPAQAAVPASPHYNYPPVRPTNVLGIVTLVLGVLGFAIVPVITGHIALAQIKRTGDDGRGITIAGLVLGYIGLAGYVLAALFFFGALFLGFLGAVSSYR
ncbi:DUF4190 domain-containing protein [Agreia pratensis]|uniref:DUF4190 domain-containing protein n=1 Tax=Agreia pratensis TaxID=150121 RepID=A0A1X7IKP8_9MICO|nr:DUF4190 domain-containing protein [Agreia pratensis]MBF4633084.1 DUF4190 domain-containing protein [Agreia pratensis]SMG15479.1 protein of unknown function [Agreia pratensis]